MPSSQHSVWYNTLKWKPFSTYRESEKYQATACKDAWKGCIGIFVCSIGFLIVFSQKEFKNDFATEFH